MTVAGQTLGLEGRLLQLRIARLVPAGDLRAVVSAVAAESERGLPVAQETRR